MRLWETSVHRWGQTRPYVAQLVFDDSDVLVPIADQELLARRGRFEFGILELELIKRPSVEPTRWGLTCWTQFTSLLSVVFAATTLLGALLLVFFGYFLQSSNFNTRAVALVTAVSLSAAVALSWAGSRWRNGL